MDIFELRNFLNKCRQIEQKTERENPDPSNSTFFRMNEMIINFFVGKIEQELDGRTEPGAIDFKIFILERYFFSLSTKKDNKEIQKRYFALIRKYLRNETEDIGANKFFLMFSHYEKISEQYYRTLNEILIFLNDNIQRINEIWDININFKPERNKIKNSLELLYAYANPIISYCRKFYANKNEKHDNSNISSEVLQEFYKQEKNLIDNMGKMLSFFKKVKEETIDDYSERCESLDCVRFVKADYSLNELEQYDKLSYELLQQYSVVSFGVDRKNNRYEICVETNDYNEVVHEVNKMGLGDIIHVKSSGKALLCSTPIIGGYRIDKVNNTGSFTACIGGYYNGQEALLTAGHNNEGSPNFYRSGSLIGSVTMQRCNTVANNTSISAYGDFAVIALNSNYNGTNTIQSSSGTVVSITGTFSSVPVGTTIFKYGYSTGHSWGIVSMVNETVVSYGNLYQYTVRGLTRSVMQNATQTNAINYGDSGGPVYINDGTYKLQGSVQGFQLPQNGGVNSVMRSSPIYYTVQAGFTPKTY